MSVQRSAPKHVHGCACQCFWHTVRSMDLLFASCYKTWDVFTSIVWKITRKGGCLVPQKMLILRYAHHVAGNAQWQCHYGIQFTVYDSLCPILHYLYVQYEMQYVSFTNDQVRWRMLEEEFSILFLDLIKQSWGTFFSPLYGATLQEKPALEPFSKNVESDATRRMSKPNKI